MKISEEDSHDALHTTLCELYLGLFTFPNNESIVISVTRHTSAAPCIESSFSSTFTNFKDIPNCFYKWVYEVIFNSLSYDIFHWDIRPANILFQYSSEQKFVIIDWESSYFFNREESMYKLIHDLVIFSDKEYAFSQYLNPASFESKFASACIIFERLMDCCLRFVLCQFN